MERGVNDAGANQLPIANSLPASRSTLPALVYLSDDLPRYAPKPSASLGTVAYLQRLRTLSQLGIIATLQSAASVGILICRWTPDERNPILGVCELDDPLTEGDRTIVDINAIRRSMGGATINASWPQNERFARGAEHAFTGLYGRPRLLRDSSNARLFLSLDLMNQGLTILDRTNLAQSSSFEPLPLWAVERHRPWPESATRGEPPVEPDAVMTKCCPGCIFMDSRLLPAPTLDCQGCSRASKADDV